MDAQEQNDQLKRAHIWKRVRIALLLAAMGVVAFAILFPVFARAEQNRQHRIKTAHWLAENTTKVSKTEQGALLEIKPRRQRGFRVDSDGDNNLDFHAEREKPLVLPVKANSQFRFAYRHSSGNYRVRSISSTGVLIEIMGTAVWRTKNKEVLLSWS